MVFRIDLDQWVQIVQRLLVSCKEACSWLVELLASPEGTGYLKYVCPPPSVTMPYEVCLFVCLFVFLCVCVCLFRPFLLECTNREVRQAFCRIISTAVQTYISHGGMPPVRPEIC